MAWSQRRGGRVLCELLHVVVGGRFVGKDRSKTLECKTLLPQ